MTVFAAAPDGEFLISLDTTGGGAFTIPAGGPYDLEGRVRFAQPSPATSQAVVALADGAVLIDPAGLHRNVTLQGNGSAAAAVQFTGGHGMEVDLGSIVENAGAAPMIDIPAGADCSIYFNRYSRAVPTAAEVVTIGAGATLRASFQTDSQSLDDWATGDVTATLSIDYDASYDRTTLSAAPGTVTEDATDTIASLGEALFLSPVDYIVNYAGGASALGAVAGNFSVGCRIAITAPVTIRGVRFAWPNVAPAARTIRCSVWRAAVRMTFVDYALVGPGVYSALFAAPLQITAANLASTASFYYSIWDTSGAHYCQLATDLAWPGTVLGSTTTPYQLSNHIIAQTPHRNYNAGDSAPVNTGFNNHYPSELIF